MTAKLETLYQHIDLAEVQAALNSEPSLSYVDVLMLGTRLQKAATLWLVGDMESQALWTEQEFDFPQAHGIMDIVRVADGVGSIVDWKTTHSIDRPNFVEEIKADTQSALYLVYGGEWLRDRLGVDPQFIEYRCLDDKGLVKSFKVPYDRAVLEDALVQVRAVQHSYLGLKNLEVWPRNKPRSCFMGSKSGATCPFWTDCTEMTMPRGTVPVGERSFEEMLPRSKSGIKDFQRCNELFRRTRLLGGGHAEGYELSMGQAFHKAASTLWDAAWKVREVIL